MPTRFEDPGLIDHQDLVEILIKEGDPEGRRQDFLKEDVTSLVIPVEYSDEYVKCSIITEYTDGDGQSAVLTGVILTLEEWDALTKYDASSGRGDPEE